MDIVCTPDSAVRYCRSEGTGMVLRRPRMSFSASGHVLELLYIFLLGCRWYGRMAKQASLLPKRPVAQRLGGAMLDN